MSISMSKRQAGGDQRIAFPASWELYRAIAEAIADAPIRLAFDGERVELMSPGPMHEKERGRLERLVMVITEELTIPFEVMGATRWERPEAMRALEADAAFYLTADKVAAAQHGSKEVADYPIPDLAIEIDHNRPRIDRESIYAILGVQEVWIYDGEDLSIHQLQEDRSFVEVEASEFLTIRAKDVATLIQAEARDANDWARQFRAWVGLNLIR